MLNQRVAEQQANPNQFQPASLPYTADEVAKVLQRPARIAERRYRVVNAAVPGYATGNDLAMLVQQVADYSPDIVILLDSYEDLLLPSTYSGADVPGLDQLIAGKHQSVGETMKAQASKTVQNWFNQLYLVQGVQHLILKAPKAEETKTIPLNLPVNGSVAQSFASNDSELDARVNRYQANLVQIIRWSAAARKRLLIGIQPELSSRASNQMPASEQAMLNDLGDNYSQRAQTAYTKLVTAAKQATQSTNGGATVKLLDLHQLYANSKEPAFQSPTSLTDDGYKQLAEQFYQAIAVQLTVEPKPYGGG
jgi:lysophospholipase L1-like esterase